MKSTRFVLFAVCAAVAAAESAGPQAVTIDAAAQVRFGIAVATLQGTTAPTGAPTTARVLDPGPLIQLDGELATASTTFAATRDEGLRLKRAYSENRSASMQQVRTANAQAQADLQKVNAARRQLALEWGGGLAGLTAHKRAELLDELSHGKAEVARVEVPAGATPPSGGMTVEVHGNAESEMFAGVVLGTLPTVDPRMQTRGVLVELKGEAAKLPVGQSLAAMVPAMNLPPVTGVVLPRSALLRKSSHVWVYIQTSPVTFVRREVKDYHPVLAGWFVSAGFMPGDKVVEAGAAALLGVETSGAVEAN